MICSINEDTDITDYTPEFRDDDDEVSSPCEEHGNAICIIYVCHDSDYCILVRSDISVKLSHNKVICETEQPRGIPQPWRTQESMDKITEAVACVGCRKWVKHVRTRISVTWFAICVIKIHFQSQMAHFPMSLTFATEYEEQSPMRV